MPPRKRKLFNDDEIIGNFLESQEVRMPLSSLNPHPNNPRQTNSLNKLKESLQANRQYRRLSVQKSTMYVITGNHTFQAMKELGWTHADITLLEISDEE